MKYLVSPVLLFAAITGLTGCAVSLQPFYTENSIVDDRSLEGRWTDGEAEWRLSRVGTGRYEIAVCDEDDCKPDTIGVLFQTAGVTFLDFSEKIGPLSTSLRLHGLFQVQLRGGDLDLTILDTERLSKLAERQALDTEFADTDSGAILTARPENLQRFVVRHLNDGLVFGETHRLRRVNF